MTKMNDNNGCSICAAGSENYETFSTRIGRKRVKRVQYDYRHTDGELFSCIGGTLTNAGNAGTSGSTLKRLDG